MNQTGTITTYAPSVYKQFSIFFFHSQTHNRAHQFCVMGKTERVRRNSRPLPNFPTFLRTINDDGLRTKRDTRARDVALPPIGTYQDDSEANHNGIPRPLPHHPPNIKRDLLQNYNIPNVGIFDRPSNFIENTGSCVICGSGLYSGMIGNVTSGICLSCSTCSSNSTSSYERPGHGHSLHGNVRRANGNEPHERRSGVGRVESGDRPIQCSVCPASFQKKFNLTSHVSNAHDKYKPFICSVCFRRVARKSHCGNHVS